jgi:hypothetical protein
MLPGNNGTTNSTTVNPQTGLQNGALNTTARTNNAAVAAQQLNALGNGLTGVGSRNFSYWGANGLGNGYGLGSGGYGNGMYGNGNGTYVLVYVPNVGWVMMPLRVVMSMMGGMGGGFGGMGGMGGFGGGAGGMF